jgi:hypothetical protein
VSRYGAYSWCVGELQAKPALWPGGYVQHLASLHPPPFTAYCSPPPQPYCFIMGQKHEMVAIFDVQLNCSPILPADPALACIVQHLPASVHTLHSLVQQQPPYCSSKRKWDCIVKQCWKLKLIEMVRQNLGNLVLCTMCSRSHQDPLPSFRTILSNGSGPSASIIGLRFRSEYSNTR